MVTSSEMIDAGEHRISARFMTALSMAAGKVYYKGQPVAAVAATSPAIAKEALSLIDVEYEPLPVVDSIEEAMKPDAPSLHGESVHDKSLAGQLSVPPTLLRTSNTSGATWKKASPSVTSSSSGHTEAKWSTRVAHRAPSLYRSSPCRRLLYGADDNPRSVANPHANGDDSRRSRGSIE